MKDPLNKLYQYFYAQSQAFKDKEQHKVPLPGFVTISRQAGAGGVTVGEKLAHYLNEALPSTCSWTVFDNDLVNEVIKDHNFPERMKTYLKEACLPGVEDWLEELLGVHPAQSTLVDRTKHTIHHLAHMGRCIIVGHGAPVITKYLPGGIHVRLVAGPKNRKEHLKKYYKLDDKEAEKFMADEDHGRADYLKKYFDHNIDDPLLYDVIINTDSVSYDEAALLIKDMVIRKIKSEELSAV
jgi:cytidylate kinase